MPGSAFRGFESLSEDFRARPESVSGIHAERPPRKARAPFECARFME
nr:MAG TPA: hypothetical protein [Caudoviricetes sp.]